MKLADLFISTRVIRAVVRDALRCGCPDDVFDDIQVGLPVLFGTHELSSGIEILVGRRLLLTLLPFQDLRTPEEEVRLVLENGRKVRDQHAFNRFRLVIVGDFDMEQRHQLEQLGEHLADRVHLHVLDCDALRRIAL